jgi:hypothetical protein
LCSRSAARPNGLQITSISRSILLFAHIITQIPLYRMFIADDRPLTSNRRTLQILVLASIYAVKPQTMGHFSCHFDTPCSQCAHYIPLSGRRREILIIYRLSLQGSVGQLQLLRKIHLVVGIQCSWSADERWASCDRARGLLKVPLRQLSMSMQCILQSN